jgi:ABC-type Fe3+-hydroxamate transport system substrate-binding protein
MPLPAANDVDDGPRTVVSLVPSLTETLIFFGLGDRLVGRTRYCVEPADAVSRIECVGGTKNPDIARIVALAPDLVVVNKEENRLEDWRALVDAGLDVHVTHPRTVAEAADMIEELGRRAGAPHAAAVLARECRETLATIHANRGMHRLRTFCPIWRNPWMTFGASTYIGSVLDAVGMENVFAADATADFFEIEIEEALARDPEIIVLPDEPYVFGRKHGEDLRARGAKGELV